MFPKLVRSMKNHKVAWIVGGIAAVVIVGKVMNDKNGWYDRVTKKQLPGVPTPPAPAPGPAPTPAPVEGAAYRASAQPRGKLPWSTGDVEMWD